MELIRAIIFSFFLTGCGTHVLVSQKTCKKNDYQLGRYSNEKVSKKVSKRYKTPFGNFRRYKVSVNSLLGRDGKCQSRREYVSIEVEDDLWAALGQFFPLFPNQKINTYLIKN